jgi:hypothetical protein
MNGIPSLETALLDLLYEVRDKDIPLIIGGGFGIYLRMQHIRKSGGRTLFSSLPEVRSTNDLELFLRVELLLNSEKLKPLADAILHLGYKPVRGAENYQFAKTGPDNSIFGSIKIDLLTGPRRFFKDSRLRIDARRVRPNPSVGIHAHPVDEVPTLEEKLLPVILAGTLITGTKWETEVFLPHTYSFLLMKLFAFRDRVNDSEKGLGRHHALDMYTIVGLTAETEWQECIEFSKKMRADTLFVEAGNIITEYFSNKEQLGLLRIQENEYYRPDFQLNDFIAVLAELFSMT